MLERVRDTGQGEGEGVKVMTTVSFKHTHIYICLFYIFYIYIYLFIHRCLNMFLNRHVQSLALGLKLYLIQFFRAVGLKIKFHQTSYELWSIYTCLRILLATFHIVCVPLTKPSLIIYYFSCFYCLLLFFYGLFFGPHVSNYRYIFPIR